LAHTIVEIIKYFNSPSFGSLLNTVLDKNGNAKINEARELKHNKINDELIKEIIKKSINILV